MFRRLILLLITGVLLLSCALPTGSKLPTPTLIETSMPTPSDPTPVPVAIPNAFAAARSLGRGVNMGNALEAPSEGVWGVTIREAYFDRIKAAGFDSIRLPVRWSAHARAQAPYDIDADFLARVDQVIGWALGRGLIVVLNIHHYEEMAVDPAGHEQRFLALWQQIAAHYRDYPAGLFFEPLNEPNSTLTALIWNRLVKEALAVIRKTNPERIAVIGGVNWNAYDQLPSLELPADDRHIIASYHYYNPFQFTHQGAEWVNGAGDWLGTVWDASDARKTEITAQFDSVAAWAKTHDRPVYLGEFGAYSKADDASRARWTAFVARQAEARGFAWAYWEFCSGFGVYDPLSNTWHSGLLEALLP